MANKLPTLNETTLNVKGLKVAKYTSELGGSFNEMEVGQIFGFKNIKPSSLYAIKSTKQRDSFGEKRWEVLGVDLANRVFFVKRIS